MVHPYSCIWPIRGCATEQGMVFLLSVLNSVYYFVLNYGQGIAYMTDLICLMKFVCAPSIQKQLYLPINDLKQDGVHFVLCPGQVNKIEDVVLNRVYILVFILSQTGSGFQTFNG